MFDYHPRTRLIFGNDSIDRVGDLARDQDGSRVLLVTDAGVLAAGHVQRALDRLDAAGLQTIVFDGVHENPTTRDVDRCLELAKASNIDLIIGLGGGSSLDTAKGCNFLLTNGGQMSDYWGVGKATRPMLPMIAVPTTAGTGSECQSYALIADETTRQKMACGDPKAAPAVAILDPTLTVTQPRAVTACTGIDAVAHAVETYVTTKRTALSMMYSRQAFRLTINHLDRVLDDADDLEARAAMLLGAAWAGTAIENSMLGAAHAAANPLTARNGIVHGHAVGMMLPHVIRYNAQDLQTRQAYAELAADTDIAPNGNDAAAATEALIDRIQQLLEAANLPQTLPVAGVATSVISDLATEAARQWTSQFNPRPIDQSDYVTIYEAACGQPQSAL